MRRFRAALLPLVLLVASPAAATPFYSVRAGHSCNTCHIEPTGWKNPAVRDRRCTLDCRGCHVDPTGGGMRRPAGRFYGLTDVAMFGPRPDAHTHPDDYRDPGDTSTPGRFRIQEGFTGWNPPDGGSHPLWQIANRFGLIDPYPKLSIGGDLRVMGYFATGAKPAIFPMQADVYGMARPVRHATLYASAGLQGARKRTFEEPDTGHPKPIDYLALRELFVQSEGWPNGAYVRAGRFNKPHGWMIPDHTTFVRRDEGFDQSSQAFGVEAGFDANYPYANVDVLYQGVAGWPGEQLQRGIGTGFNVGYRWLAAQAGASGEFVRFTKGGSELVAGPIWAINAYPLAYIGEWDVKSNVPDGGARTVNAFYALDEIDWLIRRGVTAQLKYDWEDPDIHFKDDQRHRYTIGIQLDPYGHLQLVTQFRQNFSGAKHWLSNEGIVMVHAWF